MSIIMDNARLGAIRQYDLADDAAFIGDVDLANEHWKAADLLVSLYDTFIPCLDEELSGPTGIAIWTL